MDVNQITSLITTVGFPIVVCGILFWYIYQTQENHKAEIDSLTDALNNNTIILTKLCDKLDADREK